MPPQPVALPANQPPDRFYAGGERIAAFRGTPWRGGNVPEDWIASVTTVFGEERIGLSSLPDGATFRDAVAADPRVWLGPDHLARYGPDPMLLTKLLDAGQRLPVHIHPDRPFAAEHLGRAHGKTEAWLILRGGDVHLGLREDVDARSLAEMVASQDAPRLLAAMHRFEVAPGDGVLVPAGMPHAIGAGVFLLEVQEPEDLSILLEWDGFALDGAEEGHLGLGFDLALTATDLTVRSRAAMEGLFSRSGEAGRALPLAADPFFRVDHVTPGATLEPAFAVLVVTAGTGELRATSGSWVVEVAVGTTLAVPYEAGPFVLIGDAEVLRCRPPAPEHAP